MKKYMFMMLMTIQTLIPATIEDRQDHVMLDSFVIKFIDGTSLLNISEIIHYAKNLFRLTKGTTVTEATALCKEYHIAIDHRFEDYADEKGRVGLVWFQGRYHTVKEMCIFEHKNSRNPELAEALWKTLDFFERLSESYVSEIESAKNVMVKLIDQWSHLRNRPNTLLLNWAKIDKPETSGVHATMQSFETFDIFVTDLLLFLKDFMHNCPKSLHAYKEQQKLQQQHKNESIGEN